MSTIVFDSPVNRIINENLPIIFDWPRTGVNPSVSVAFDNLNFVPILGVVDEIGAYKYRIAYNAADRPLTPSLITYKVQEGGDEGTFELLLISQQQNPTPSPLTDYGPKRVRTKEMDIEQWSPDMIHSLNVKKTYPKPCFCDSTFCHGVPE
jgi:hypothetical protein